MYCKYFKLVSGDNIIASTEDNCDSFEHKEFLKIVNPVQVGLMRFPRNGILMETHVFMPWIAMSSTENVMLSTKNIIVTVDVEDRIANQYNSYVSRTDKRTVLDEQNNFTPSLYEDELEDEELLEDEEELEDDNNDDDSNGRTLH